MRLDPETIDVSIEELERVVDRARQQILNAEDHRKLRAAVETLGQMARRLADKDATLRELRHMLLKPATTEKTRAVLERAGATPTADGKPGEPAVEKKKRKGHGRKPASAFVGAPKVEVPHPTLQSGDRCPECGKGKLYPMKEPAVRVRIVGQAPIQATVYELARLRCNLCQEVYEAPPPESMGASKRDPTAASMVAVLKYGSGVPFYRLAGLQADLGIPLPPSTQWDMMVHAAVPIEPVFEELIRQAAQGQVVYNDDTAMRILALQRETAEDRTGVFTTGIVATTLQGRRITLFFSGDKHAGENLAEVLRRRAAESPPPIQMCDALSRNVPRGFAVILANCLTHCRRHYVEVAANFAPECRYVLETLGAVYGHDEEARRQEMTDAERLAHHQARSAPLMEQLQQWGRQQLDEHRVEPNSGLGQAITYMLRHWEELTLFLRQAGAPLDSNIVERALKKAILHRKNALFYKTRNGAHVGDLFMSLIHTCESCGANPFDYLTELQCHAAELAQNPAQWMPWNYRATLAEAAALTRAA